MTFEEWVKGMKNMSNDSYLGLARAAWDYQQAKIDQLMLEYCPEEMTVEQLIEWRKHQRVEYGI